MGSKRYLSRPRRISESFFLPSVQFKGTGTLPAMMQPMRRWSVAAKEGMKIPILSALMLFTESAMSSVTTLDFA